MPEINDLEKLIDKLIDKYNKLKKEHSFYKEQYFEMKENVEKLIEKLTELEKLTVKNNQRGYNGKNNI